MVGGGRPLVLEILGQTDLGCVAYRLWMLFIKSAEMHAYSFGGRKCETIGIGAV